MRPMLAILLVATAGGCGNEVVWQITEGCPGSPGGSLVWLVAPGECGFAPEPLFVGTVGVDDVPTLEAGTYCFAAMRLTRGEPGQGVCRLHAIASITRTLPRDRGVVPLALGCAALAGGQPDARWDAYVVALGNDLGCSPACDSARCACGRSQGCLSRDPSGRPAGVCPGPLEADLVAASDDHVCVARQGEPNLTCWGARRGFGDSDQTTGEPQLVTSMAVAAIAAGPGLTCVLRTDNTVNCVGAAARPDLTLGLRSVRDIAIGLDGAGATMLCTVNRSREMEPTVQCPMMGGFQDADLGEFLELAVGNEGGCVLGDSQIACWPERTSDAFHIPSPDGVGWHDVDVRDDLGCGVTLAGRVACWNRLDPAVTTTDVNIGPGESIRATSVALGGALYCARAQNEVWWCGARGESASQMVSFPPTIPSRPVDVAVMPLAYVLVGAGVTVVAATGRGLPASDLFGLGNTTDGSGLVCPP